MIDAAIEAAALMSELGLPFALVGGLAVAARAELRFTGDVDLAGAIPTRSIEIEHADPKIAVWYTPVFHSGRSVDRHGPRHVPASAHTQYTPDGRELVENGPDATGRLWWSRSSDADDDLPRRGRRLR